MAKVDLYEFSDLLECAEKIGYNWNQAHDILEKADILPWPGESKNEVYKSELKGKSEDAINILNAFMDEKGITSFVLTIN